MQQREHSLRHASSLRRCHREHRFSSIAPCASCVKACGTGRHRTPNGGRPSRGARTSRPTRSTTARGCCSSIRSACRASSRTLAAERDTAIVLTAPWHERDAESLVERLGVPVLTPLPDSAQYLMDTYGITAEQAGDGSPDLVWLLREQKGEARPYSPGDRLPFGADVFPGHKPNDTVLWIESQRAVISGDTLVDFGQRPRDQRAVAPPGRHARGDRRRAAPTARVAGRARACDARRADRPGRTRASACLIRCASSTAERHFERR